MEEGRSGIGSNAEEVDDAQQPMLAQVAGQGCWSWRRAGWRAALLLGAVVATGGAGLALRCTKLWQSHPRGASPRAITQEADVSYAGAGMDMVASAWGSQWESLMVGRVSSSEACAQVCQENSRCESWLWVRQASGLCYLRTDKALGAGQRAPAHAPVTSGVGEAHTDGVEEVSGVVTRTTTTTTSTSTRTTTTITTTSVIPGSSMLCFSLARRGGGEVQLLRTQHDLSTGIFGCDAFSIYSNTSFQVAPGVHSTLVNVSLECEAGGEFGTALNTDIFFEVWRTLIAEDRYTSYDWTVKADADTVFLPMRLRFLTTKYKPSRYPGGMYLNNCQYGLHGPLEVFARDAVTSWGRGMERCQKYFTKLCKGPCQWGEDMFIDQCFKRVLKVHRMDNRFLLFEDHCDAPDGWKSCEDDSRVAFHPFKTVSKYVECLNNTRSRDS